MTVTIEALEPATAAPPPLAEGTELAPGYEVISHVNRGRALDVYQVWSEARRCRCAAKVLRPDRVSEPRPRKRLLREGRLLHEFTHPHIVRAYETIESPDPVVILEAIGAHTLARILRGRRPNVPLLSRRSRRLSFTELAALGTHMSSAIAYLHSHGYLHLDIKPANIVSERGVAKVLDLSVAGRPGRRYPGRGTRAWMAPEQVRGGIVSEATDVWGIGLILHVAATTRYPFESNAVHPQVEAPAPPIRSARRLPHDMAELIDAALAPEPERRPTTDDLYRGLDARL